MWLSEYWCTEAVVLLWYRLSVVEYWCTGAMVLLWCRFVWLSEC